MNHGWDVRPEGKQFLKERPEVSIRRLYFDSLLHFEPALRYVVETFGADHVLLGSDYPFDMGMTDASRRFAHWVCRCWIGIRSLVMPLPKFSG